MGGDGRGWGWEGAGGLPTGTTVSGGGGFIVGPIGVGGGALTSAIGGSGSGAGGLWVMIAGFWQPLSVSATPTTRTKGRDMRGM